MDHNTKTKYWIAFGFLCFIKYTLIEILSSFSLTLVGILEELKVR